MPLTVTTTESTIVICYTKQIIPVGWYLRIRGRFIEKRVTRTRGKGRGHVICEIKALHREVDQRLDLVCERSFDREPFKVNEEDGRESRKNQLFGCLS
jgi:hypothetical protein